MTKNPRPPAAGKSLADWYPDLAAEWHPEKNGALTAVNVSSGTEKLIWWLCDVAGHEWEATVYHRAKRGQGCPYCSGRRAKTEESLTAQFPKIVAEWHPAKNGSVPPQDLRAFSHKKVWWICQRGHEWEATIYQRTKLGHGCYQCEGKEPPDDTFASLFPKIAASWHPSKNGKLEPEQFRPQSHKKAWWICQRGHEWEAQIKDRVNG